MVLEASGGIGFSQRLWYGVPGTAQEIDRDDDKPAWC